MICIQESSLRIYNFSLIIFLRIIFVLNLFFSISLFLFRIFTFCFKCSLKVASRILVYIFAAYVLVLWFSPHDITETFWLFFVILASILICYQNFLWSVTSSNQFFLSLSLKASSLLNNNIVNYTLSLITVNYSMSVNSRNIFLSHKTPTNITM